MAGEEDEHVKWIDDANAFVVRLDVRMYQVFNSFSPFPSSFSFQISVYYTYFFLNTNDPLRSNSLF